MMMGHGLVTVKTIPNNVIGGVTRGQKVKLGDLGKGVCRFH